MDEALEYSMHKAGLRGTRTDLQKFVDTTFDDEVQEQRKLLAQVQKGEADQKTHQDGQSKLSRRLANKEPRGQ